jgi:Co/Zn/Cd efflux system component
MPGVIGFSDPHFWPNTADDIVGSINVRVEPKAIEQVILQKISKLFKHKGVHHMTVQISKDAPIM